jgi:hypothetical protein
MLETLNEIKKQLCDKMIKKYGLESKRTIYFCKFAEEVDTDVSVLRLFFELY